MADFGHAIRGAFVRLLFVPQTFLTQIRMQSRLLEAHTALCNPSVYQLPGSRRAEYRVADLESENACEIVGMLRPHLSVYRVVRGQQHVHITPLPL